MATKPSTKGVKPQVLHIRRSGDLFALCGAGSRNIAEQYNTDAYMSSLHVCSNCRAVLE